ncbi:enoyl-CoA hydratase/isomerase family protein [Mesorhizobium erdmanii]|uniref:enoyl-CoA hydratase/isomerase family protein n=1 Tax=Mesorhizobium erdmanii TaxID=1777866 RepID=UPI0003FD5D65|nr:enoyl-CoA hydratase/isomerase family protein [Mesorhizobium erdmanii]
MYDYKQFSVQLETPSLWRVIFDNPPINMVNHETLQELYRLTSEMAESGDLKVVVFESANADFFLAHWDIASKAPASTSASEAPSWMQISLRLANAPVVSIASIRGRARGIGSEIALGCDMRFASIEKAIFGQPEVGVGLVPGGGSLERLPMLSGRARALEIVLGGNDFDAQTAERYGWINRALPDAQLDSFVMDLARRIASFDKQALTAAKRLLNRGSIPSEDHLKESQATFSLASGWPGAQARGRKSIELGMGKHNDFEMNLAAHLPALAAV